MTPGLAFFYGGMVRAKNVLNMLMMNFFTISIVTVIWVLVGWTVAFGGEGGGIIGDFSEMGFEGLSGDGLLIAMFQMTFAIITPALIAGAVAGRMKFKAGCFSSRCGPFLSTRWSPLDLGRPASGPRRH
jgi:Amt family ammonium transporter